MLLFPAILLVEFPIIFLAGPIRPDENKASRKVVAGNSLRAVLDYKIQFRLAVATHHELTAWGELLRGYGAVLAVGLINLLNFPFSELGLHLAAQKLDARIGIGAMTAAFQEGHRGMKKEINCVE